MQNISKEQSDLIWRLKGLAVFTIFFAHMPYSGTNVGMIYIFNFIGMIGVPTFLILSGFFDYGSSATLKKVVKTLFAPLFIWGLITYFIWHYKII